MQKNDKVVLWIKIIDKMLKKVDENGGFEDEKQTIYRKLIEIIIFAEKFCDGNKT